MLNAPWPAATVFVLKYRIVFTSLSVVVPFCAVLTLFSREFIRSFYAIGLLTLLTLVEIVTLISSLLSPFKLLIQALGGNLPR